MLFYFNILITCHHRRQNFSPSGPLSNPQDMASSSVNLLVPHLSNPVLMTYRPRIFHPLSSILRLPNRILHLPPLLHFSPTFIVHCFVYLPQPQPLSNQPFGLGGTLTGKQPHLTPTPAHHFHILSRTLTSAKTRHVTVPLPSLNWLLSHFPSDPYQFPIHHDVHATLPAPLLSDLLMKYELLHPPSSNVTRTQFSTPLPSHMV